MANAPPMFGPRIALVALVARTVVMWGGIYAIRIPALQVF